MAKLRLIHRVLLLLTTAYALGVLTIGVQATLAAPSPFPDAATHWAAAEIRQWQTLGLTGGYSDGTFRPEQATSRGEFLAFANRAFGLVAQAEVTFTDVLPTHRWYGDIAKAVAAGYAAAYADGTFRPDQALTRLEAGEMLYAILHLQPAETDQLARFTDGQMLAGDQRAMLNAVVAGGYLGGFPDNTIRPQGTITRAQMVVTLSRAAGRIYNQPGTYGTELRPTSIAGNVTINKAGVRLRSMTIHGDLRLGQSIADGEVYLQNVTVHGTTWISGGGSDCVIASEGTTLNAVVVADLNHNVKLVFDQVSSARDITWDSGGSFEGSSVAPGQPKMRVSDSASGQTLRVSGQVSEIRIDGSVQLYLDSVSELRLLEVMPTANQAALFVAGRVTDLRISAPGSSLHVDQDGSISRLNNTETLQCTLAGTMDLWQANAPFQLLMQTGSSLQNLEVAAAASDSSISRSEANSVGTIKLTEGSRIQVDGVTQTASGSPATNSPDGSGNSGGAGGTPGGGPAGKQPIRASAVYVNMSSGAVSGEIGNGVDGTINLSSFADDTAIYSMNFVAPAGSTLDLLALESPDLGREELNKHLESLTVTVNDLLERLSSINIGTLREFFGNSVVIKGLASSPGYLSAEVSLTVRLR